MLTGYGDVMSQRSHIHLSKEVFHETFQLHD